MWLTNWEKCAEPRCLYQWTLPWLHASLFESTRYSWFGDVRGRSRCNSSPTEWISALWIAICLLFIDYKTHTIYIWHPPSYLSCLGSDGETTVHADSSSWHCDLSVESHCACGYQYTFSAANYREREIGKNELWGRSIMSTPHSAPTLKK